MAGIQGKQKKSAENRRGHRQDCVCYENAA